jgi:iron(III) transport system ATP-binding protein
MVELSIENLSVRYGALEVLKGVSLQLQKGEIGALLGSSGSGKTTLLRTIAGLVTPSSGKIELAGTSVFESSTKLDTPIEKRNLGFVFQSYALWPHRTVEANVGYPLKLRGIAKADRARRVKACLDQLGLGHLLDRYPHQLSGGQQQRVAIARALVYQPSLILFDEPLSNLDAKLREEARIFLKTLIKRENLSALLVTHDQEEALAMADRIFLMNGGVIEQADTPVGMYSSPKTQFVAEFMGKNNRISGVLEKVDASGATLRCGDISLRGLAQFKTKKSGDKATAVIRVEDTLLCRETSENVVTLPASTSLFLGTHWQHRFERGTVSILANSSDSLSEPSASIKLPREKLWIF